MLESAFVPPSPLKPNRLLIVVVGALLGLAMGSGAALLREATDLTFHAARDIQAALAVPVLAAIPGILLDADRRALRHRRVVVGMGVAALVGAVLTGSAIGYVSVNGQPGFLKSLTKQRPGQAAPQAPPAPQGSPSASAGEAQRG